MARGLRLGWRGFRWACKTLWIGLRALVRWASCGFLLFYSSSKRLFTLRTIPLIALVLGVWVAITLRTLPDLLGEAPLEPALKSIFPISILLAILFSMNIVPREDESRTIEVFFSLPVRRYRLVIWHLTTVSLWLLFLLLFQAGSLRFITPNLSIGALLLRAFPSLVCVSCLTVWISTLTRNGPAAGLIAALICFSHLYRIRSFGPVQLFQSPFLSVPGGSAAWGLPQVILLGLLCVLLTVQINQRLKKSELWFR